METLSGVPEELVSNYSSSTGALVMFLLNSQPNLALASFAFLPPLNRKPNNHGASKAAPGVII